MSFKVSEESFKGGAKEQRSGRLNSVGAALMLLQPLPLFPMILVACESERRSSCAASQL